MNWNETPEDPKKSPQDGVGGYKPMDESAEKPAGATSDPAQEDNAVQAEQAGHIESDDAQINWAEQGNDETQEDELSSFPESGDNEPFVGQSDTDTPIDDSPQSDSVHDWGNDEGLSQNLDQDDMNSEEDEETEEEFVDDPDEPVKNKPSKVKTLALMGGVVIGLVALVGGGLAVKFGGSGQPAQNQPVPTLPVEPEQPRAQSAVNQVQPQDDGVPAYLKEDNGQNPQPAQVIQENVAPVSSEPVPYIDPMVLQALLDADILDKLNQLAEHQTAMDEKVASLTERVVKVESNQDQYDKDLEALKKAIEARESKDTTDEAQKNDEGNDDAPSKSAAKSDSKTTEVAKAPAPKPKPAAKPAPKKVAAAKPRPAPKPRIQAPRVKPNSELVSARVVGIYPSRNPTLAYVVSDRGLTTVRPGDVILGARVLRLDGMSVVTTAGRIQAQ